MTTETTFHTYGQHLDEGQSGTLVLWERPSAEERAMLVVPFTYCPNIAELLDQSNWHVLQTEIGAAARRVDRARRHVQYVIKTRTAVHYADNNVLQVGTFAREMVRFRFGATPAKAMLCKLVDLPVIEGETVKQFAARLDSARETSDYQTASFGHWATPYDLLLVRAGSRAHAVAEKLMARYANYPVLDESDFSERESQAFSDDLTSELESLTIVVNGVELEGESPEYDALFYALDRTINEQETQHYCDQSDLESALLDLGFEYDWEEMTWTGSLKITEASE